MVSHGCHGIDGEGYERPHQAEADAGRGGAQIDLTQLESDRVEAMVLGCLVLFLGP